MICGKRERIEVLQNVLLGRGHRRVWDVYPISQKTVRRFRIELTGSIQELVYNISRKKGVFEPCRTSKCLRHSRAHPCVKAQREGSSEKVLRRTWELGGERKETEQKQTTTMVK